MADDCPPIGTENLLCVGGVCYPHCQYDEECPEQLACANAGEGLGGFCAWPDSA